MTHHPISPEFRLLYGSPIRSDSSDDESWPRTHMPLAYQELPPPFTAPVYPAHLCNRMLSSEIRKCFMPEDCPESQRSWYMLDIDELLPQQLAHVTKVIEGMLETNFEGWDSDYTRAARGPMAPARGLKVLHLADAFFLF